MRESERDQLSRLLVGFESHLCDIARNLEDDASALRDAAELFGSLRSTVEQALHSEPTEGAAPPAGGAIARRDEAAAAPAAAAPQAAVSARLAVLEVLRQTPVPLVTAQIAAVAGLAMNVTRARLSELRLAGDAERTAQGWIAR